MKRKFVKGGLIGALLLVGSMTMVADKHYRNQLASMEYKQWKFSPEYYYKSWYNEKILFITTKVPGLGLHDNGPGGIGGGDNYINERWRQMTPLRMTAVGENELQGGQVSDEQEYWEDLMTQDAITYADASTAVPVIGAWSVTSNDRNKYLTDIRKNINGFPEAYASVADRYLTRLEVVTDEMNCVKNAYMSNSRKLTLLQDANRRLMALAQETEEIKKALELYEGDICRVVRKKGRQRIIF